MAGNRKFNYKGALSQPYWIQRISRKFILRNPIEGEALLVGGMFATVQWIFLRNIYGLVDHLNPTLKWFILGISSYVLAKAYMRMAPDGKKPHEYVLGYLKYPFELKKNECIYKGIKRRKP